MNRTFRAAVIGIVSVALLVSVIGVLPAVDARRAPHPICTVAPSSHAITHGQTVHLLVTVSNGPHSVSLSAAITVARQPIRSTSSTDTTTVHTNNVGTGTVTVTYPTDFPYPASTHIVGGYSVTAVVTGYSVAVSCHTTFAVVH